MKNFILKFKKWIITCFLGSAVLGAGLMGADKTITIDQKIDKKISDIETIIKTDKQPNGKYKRQDKKKINGIEYEVHEYETSKGEIGYTIFITKEKDNKIYKKAISTGVEKASREFDWKIIKDNNIYEATTMATSTKK